ncbi:MAG: YraN family protein [Eubacteriales bacterium]
MPVSNNRKVGQYYEEKATEYLKQQGYIILKINFRCRVGEIDIIAKDGDYLVFLEVKYRKSGKKGDPSEAVNYYKQRTITKVAQYYMVKNNLSYNTSCRFDVIVILQNKIRLIKNAFNAII